MFERNEFRIIFLHFLNTLYMLLLKMLVNIIFKTTNTCFMKFSEWYNNQNPMTGTSFSNHLQKVARFFHMY